MRRHRVLGVLLVSIGHVACAGQDEGDEHVAQEASEKPRSTPTPAAPVIAGFAGSFAIPEIGCDMNGPSHCGSSECPAPPLTLAGVCGFAVCCGPQGQCGFRSAATLDGRLVSEVCVVQAQPDSRCPEVTFATTKVPGCCDDTGHCGQLLGTLCLPVASAASCDADGGT